MKTHLKTSRVLQGKILLRPRKILVVETVIEWRHFIQWSAFKSTWQVAKESGGSRRSVQCPSKALLRGSVCPSTIRTKKHQVHEKESKESGVEMNPNGATYRPRSNPVHYGTGHFETSMIHFPTSEGVSEVSEQASKRASAAKGASKVISPE